MRDVPANPLAAETAMLELLRLDPEHYPALQRLAKYRWLFHDRTPEAISVIERAIRSDPHNPWAAHTATAFYLDVGDPAAARDVAATTPASDRTAAVVLAAYEGDWRAAGEAAMAAESFEFGFNESWLVPEALRDYALRTNDHERPRRVLAGHYDLALEGPVVIRFSNYRAAIPFAHIERLRGRDDRAREILRAVVRHVDSETNTPPVYKRRSRALALMLLGEQERALADLGASFREDRDHTQWWYALERDPVWNAVRDDPRFEALAAEVRAHAARDREAVQALRVRGEIPRRPAAAAGSAAGP
jgi:predicted Zn-dependent protease